MFKIEMTGVELEAVVNSMTNDEFWIAFGVMQTEKAKLRHDKAKFNKEVDEKKVAYNTKADKEINARQIMLNNAQLIHFQKEQ